MKIAAVIGSPKSINSSSYKLTLEFIEHLAKMIPTIEYVLYLLSDMNVANCDGCEKCFNNMLFCEKHDDMRIIANNLLSSDIIILVSPVYTHNVTSTMKNFIDRLSYWTHIMPLAGKIGIVMSSSHSNGNNLVNKYLAQTLTFWGGEVVSALDYREITYNQNLEKQNYASEIILDYINKDRALILKANEDIFQYNKSMILDYINRNIESSEVNYWIKNDLISFKTFKQFAIARNTNFLVK